MDEKNTDAAQNTSSEENVQSKNDTAENSENLEVQNENSQIKEDTVTKDLEVQNSTALVDNEENTEVTEEEEDVALPPAIEAPNPTQKKLQIVLGLISGMAIWLSLGIGYYMVEIQGENTFFSWLFVIVFAVIMFSRRFYENKKHVHTQVFSKYFLIGLIVFLGVYLLVSYLNGWLTN